MKKLPCPIKVHSGLKPIVTQPFGDTTTLAWYKERGMNIPFHNGTDIILSGTDVQTYGSELITPSEGWRIVKATFDAPMSTKGNGVTIQSPQFEEDGIQKVLQVVYWHASHIEFDSKVRPAYDTVANVGNTGAVRPEPTVKCPFAGSHLHLMLFEYHIINGRNVLQNANNGVGGAINPLERFDMTWTIEGKDTGGASDRYPLEWVFDKLGLKENWQKIVYGFTNWWNNK